MDIAGLSMSMSNQKISDEVSVLVMKKSLDTLETAGEGMQKMMEASVTPYLGQNIDYTI